MNAVSMQNICKSFSEIPVLKNVCFELKHGEIHALLGENGAGKSTLMHILSGLYVADSGTIAVNNTPADISNPSDAARHKIGMIFQHFMLSATHSAFENILIRRNPRPSFFLNRKNLRLEIETFCSRLGIVIDLDEKVENLNVSDQQKIEIIKTLYQGSKILIFDEPTAVLTPDETKSLFGLLKKMKAEGYSIILITHKLSEILDVSDRITVLRCGETVKTLKTAATSKDELSSLMFADIDLKQPDQKSSNNAVILSLDKICALGDQKNQVLHSVSLSLRKGEILGIAGISGNGQIELSETIAGLRKLKSGSIRINTITYTSFSAQNAIDEGIGFIPADRLKMGIARELSIAENLILKQYTKPPYSEKSILQKSAILENAQKKIETYDIRCPGIHTPAGNLSGGNLQKVILAREISAARSVIVAAYPSRGLDVRSAEYVHQCIAEFCKKGGAAIIISEEIEELLNHCTTIAVMYSGRITEYKSVHEITLQEIGHAMSGAQHDIG